MSARRVGIVAVAAVLGIGSLPGCGEDDSSGGEAAWTQLSGIAALEAAPCPDASFPIGGEASEREIAATRNARFEVFGPAGRTRLVPPVNWDRNPIDSVRYGQELDKLRYLSPLFSAYRDHGDEEALRQATELALDWVRSNPLAEADENDKAWSGKVVGDRSLYLLYIVRAAGCEGLLSRVEANELLRSISEHGEFLAADENYAVDNHGLFVDLGLYRIAKYLPFAGPAQDWEQLAVERAAATMDALLAGGIWLENSSAYQLLAIRAIERLVAEGVDDPAIRHELKGMRAAAGWLVRPDGEIVQFGDSNHEPVPGWGEKSAAQTGGLKLFKGAGLAVVRAPGPEGDDGYLAVSAAFHDVYHKHADDLSFELFDRGYSIVNDTGLYGKDPGPERDFIVSAPAHSVLTVDRRPFPITDAQSAYGSGIIAAGQGDGWYAIEAHNPLVLDQGVSHRRLFLYRPGVALVVVDDVEAERSHVYTRYFQLGPELSIDPVDASQLELSAAGFAGELYDAPTAAPALRDEARGRRDPLLGFTSPDYRILQPRWTVMLESDAEDETRAATISLDQDRLRATSAAADDEGFTVELEDEAGVRSEVVLTRNGSALAIEIRSR